MKRILWFLTALLFAVTLTACGTPATETPTEASDSAQEMPDAVVFADPVLEARVREAMGKPEGDITIAEAETVTELKLNTEYTADEPPEGTIIRDLSGLESFKNLENLELHFHAVTDISPLAGLTKLHSLSLGGNPIADITPLSGLTNLGWLTLFNCQASDYSPLANLTGLGGLLMDHSTISDVSMLSGLTELWWLGLSNTQVSDVSPLSTLVNLTQLQLEGCPITDYSPLKDIYPNLEEADFALVSSLRELGFAPIDNAPEIESYKTDELIVQVQRDEWGTPENTEGANAVTLSKNYGTENEITIVYYPETVSYLVTSHVKDFRYTYDSQSETINIEYGEENANTVINEVYDEIDPYPVMTPIRDFSKTLTNTFSVSADILYNLPREAASVSAASLVDLGFSLDGNTSMAYYDDGTASVNINHPQWGDTPEGYEFEMSAVTVSRQMDSGYRLITGYYPDEQTYCFGISLDDEVVANYFYYPDGTFRFETGDRETSEQAVQSAMGTTAAEDILLAPIGLYDDTLRDLFGMSADELYALPMEDKGIDDSSLTALGFFADEGSASYLYESQTDHYYSVQIHNPEWGDWDEGGDVRFFTPVSDAFRIVVTYYIDEEKFQVKADDNDGGGASFEFFAETNEHVDGWCSNEEITLEEYFKNGLGDPSIEDVYLYCAALMPDCLEEAFGMSITELYELPVGE
jgi:hypothetical protein